ncbi:MAG TPA: hypothetical protein VIL65_15105 [Beijerinckiaceae bacterium]|jgi:hypothetical protein
MIEDLPAIRDQLSEHWQSIAIDLVKRGFRPEAVFETLLTVGLAGHVELHGKEATADKLAAIARQLSEQVRQAAEAMNEAAGATKN